MATVGDLVTKFSFAGNITPLVKFEESLGSAINLSLKSVGAFAGVATAMSALTLKISGSNDAMVQMSRRTGLNIEQIQKLGYVASQTGSSYQAVESTLESLTQKIGDASINGSDSFAKLGIDIYNSNGQLKNAVDLFGDISSSIKGLPQAQQISFAQQLGIDKSLIQMIRLSSDEINNLQIKAQKFGVVSKRDGDIMASLNDSVTTAKFAFGSLANTFAVAMAPSLQRVVDGFSAFVAKNREFIEKVLKKAIGFVTGFTSAIDNIVKSTIGWKSATVLLSGAVAVLVARFTPFLGVMTLVGTAVSTVVWAIDDFIKYLKGMDSWTGKSLINLTAMTAGLGLLGATLFGLATSQIASAIRAIKGMTYATRAMTIATAAFEAVFSPIGLVVVGVTAAIAGLSYGIYKLYENWDKIYEPIKRFGSALLEMVLGPVRKVQNAFKWLTSWWSGDNKKEINVNATRKIEGMPSGSTISPSFLASSAINPLPVSSTLMTNNSSRSFSNNVNQTNNINITGGNTQEISENLNDVLNDNLNDLNMNTGYGGR